MVSEQQPSIIVYGTTWCGDCRRAKQFLGEHRIQYTWIDIEQDPTAMAEVERINRGLRSVPTIVLPDGGILVEPSNETLAARLGLRNTAARNFYDLIIIGAGPAGLTTAFYAAREGIDTLIVERGVPGGQIANTQRMDNYPGFDEGISGVEFAQRLTNQARRFGVEILTATSVRGLERDGRYICLATSSGASLGARAVLVATGSRYRRLNVPGEQNLIGSAIHFCAVCDGPFYRGKDVLVVGGGNSGFQEALQLSRFAKSITIVEVLPAVRASVLLQDEVAKHPGITVVTNHAVQAFLPDRGKIGGVEVLDQATGQVATWHPDGAFIFVGLDPNTDFLPAEIQRAPNGFVATGPNLETTMPGVFAAGDARAGSTKQAVAAAGEGATAALMIKEFLQKAV